MKQLFLLFTAVFAWQNSNAQSITGSVIDVNKKPIEVASISLLNAKDSTLAMGAVTDLSGNFSIENAKNGTYILGVSNIGFANYYSAVFSYEGKAVALGSITLNAVQEQLNAVQIISKKPPFEVKADKMIVNVAGSINAAGSNALELLRKSPGVTVDKDNNLTLKGKNGVVVYIDGKPSNLDQKSLAALLQNMSANDIETIELISNPSAKYDAAGNAGIINIRLKKNKKLGFNGNTEISGSQGFTPKLNASIGLNYRNQKFNAFGNYSYGNGWYANDVNFDRRQAVLFRNFNNTFDSLKQTSRFQTKSSSIDKGINHNAKLGFDYFLDKENTIGAVIGGSFDQSVQDNLSRTVIQDSATNRINSILIATGNQPTKRNNLNYNLNYRFADTSSHQLGVDVDFGDFIYTSSSNQPNTYKNDTETQILKESGFGIDYGTTVKVFTAKTDYEQKFLEGKIGVGLKYANVVTGNSFVYFDGTGASRVKNNAASNSFNYTENINAAYVNYNRDITKKWSVQAGLRLEQTNSTGLLMSSKIITDSVVKRTYLDFFPSAAITFSPSQTHSFNLTYSRRIDRASYQDLNPFENKIDLLTYQKGNPYLHPQYTNALELTHTFMGFLNTTLSASKTTDFFTEITDTASGGRNFIIKRNLGGVSNLGLNIAAPLPLAKWYNGFLNFGTNYQHYEADFGKGKTIDLNVYSWNIYMQNTFDLGKGWSSELSGFYASPSIWGGTFRTNRMWSVDMGVQKKILNDNGTLKLSLSDAFHTQRWSGVTQFGGLYMEANGGWESQRVTLKFNYRFGNQQMQDIRAHKGGSDDETKRIKSGK